VKLVLALGLVNERTGYDLQASEGGGVHISDTLLLALAFIQKRRYNWLLKQYGRVIPPHLSEFHEPQESSLRVLVA